MTETQKKLSDEQIEAFYSDLFAREQLQHFNRLTAGLPLGTHKVIVDVGGGCGYFAAEVHRSTGRPVRVIDTDEKSLETCRTLGVGAIEPLRGDALAPPTLGDEGVVCFNLILHHLVGENERATRALQKKAITAWRGKTDYIFVNEYVYDSFVVNASGRLIYEITSSRLLSTIARQVSKFIPSLKANTFGVGVRFRAHEEWVQLFRDCGYDVVSQVKGQVERLPLPRRLLLISEKRRDSYVLREVAPAQVSAAQTA